MIDSGELRAIYEKYDIWNEAQDVLKAKGRLQVEAISRPWFDFDLVRRFGPSLLWASLVTIVLAFTSMPIAMAHGLTSAIMDTRTPQIVEAIKAADLLLNRDEWGMNWIAAHRAKQAAAATTT